MALLYPETSPTAPVTRDDIARLMTLQAMQEQQGVSNGQPGDTSSPDLGALMGAGVPGFNDGQPSPSPGSTPGMPGALNAPSASFDPGGQMTMANASMVGEDSMGGGKASTVSGFGRSGDDTSAASQASQASQAAAMAAAAMGRSAMDFVGPLEADATPTGDFVTGGSVITAPDGQTNMVAGGKGNLFGGEPDSVVAAPATPGLPGLPQSSFNDRFVGDPTPTNPNTPHITVNPLATPTPAPNVPGLPTPAPSRSFGTPTPDFVAPTSPGFDLGSPAPGGTDFGPGDFGGFTSGSGNTGGFGAGYSGSADMGNTQGAAGFTAGAPGGGFDVGAGSFSGGGAVGGFGGDGVGGADGAGAGAGAGDSGGSSAGGSDGASGGVG